MNRIQENCTPIHYLLSLVIATSLSLPLPSLAASVALATAPLTTSSTSSVKPNLMFILDDSGSMGWAYLPDWANDNHPVVGTNYLNMPELFNNSGFNGLAYNPAITYTPPALFNADGTLNTTTYPSQIGTSAATGASTAAATPNWRAVKNDAYGIQSTGTRDLENNASYYVFIAGEYCSTDKLDNCVIASAPTSAGGVTYDKPAVLRWCDSSALTNCQSINNATFKFPRYPGPVSPASATLNVTNTGTATSIKVNGFEILSNATTTWRRMRTSDVAKEIRDSINNCTTAATGNCTISGYSATASGSTVTIVAPNSLGAITYRPTASGTMSATISAFSGYQSLPGSNLPTTITSSNDSYPYPGSSTKASTRTDCAGTTCTYKEEMTNYANWWTYYHTRMQAMKTSVSRAFKTLDSRFRVGFSTIGYTGASDTDNRFLGNDTFELKHKNTWFTKLFATKVPGTTPLRGALSKAGRYYGNKISGQVDPVQYSCQQNFSILSTDGYWNTNAESSSYTALDLQGNLVGDLDGGTTPLPMKQGPAASNTLADIAKYYYDTDLRTSALGNCAGGKSTDFPLGNSDVCTNEVYTSSTDNNIQQHMTTFTMGLGIDGTLNYSTDYLTAPSGDFYNLKNALGSPATVWPDPINNSTGERIDDLWHAAVNGRGIYFSAKDPDQIINGFNTAISSITAKLGSAAAAATSTLNPVAGNNFAYVASYTTSIWKGNLEARTINTATGEVSASATWCVENVAASTCASPGTVVTDNSGSSTIYNCVLANSTAASCTSPGVFNSLTSECVTQIQNACTGTMPSRVGTTSDTRKIYTSNSTGNALVAFDAAYAMANPTNFSAAHINGLNQWGLLTATQQAAAEGVNLINYLRGQTGFEDRSSNVASNRLYRAREATLGDALESQPAFLGAPNFSYADPGYTIFKNAQAGRAKTVYMGTNDGMMHAFDANNGNERWAYVPSMVIPNMWKLASTSYSTDHTNFVNGSPLTTDICVSNCGSAGALWRTVLVGGLNAGGRGYYALDITDPAAPGLLWEFTPKNDKDLGYSFGTPVITKKADGTWVVLLTSGYDNGTQSSNPLVSNSPAGDGVGHLYVLNAYSGAMISKISTSAGNPATPSGLAKIAAWNNEPAGIGNRANFVYGGDLEGNLWRFDIDTGSVMLFATLFSDASSGAPQPITTTPVLGMVEKQRVIYIGTGKYLEVSDLNTTQVQSLYAIMDNNATTTLVNPRTSLTRQQLINNTATATRSGSSTSCTGFTGRGWYLDFPDPKERVNIDGQLVQGTLIFPSIVPLNTACSPGGYGWLNFLDYQTGCAVGSVAGIKTDSSIVGVNVIYIEGPNGPGPIIEIVTATNPTPEIPTDDSGQACDWQCFFKLKPSSFKFQGRDMNWRLLK